MKKQIVFLFITTALLFMPVLFLSALDLGSGFSLGGGVKTGLEIKNSDYSGELEGIGHAKEYPMTLYFASRDNEAYNGEGWFNLNYSGNAMGINWGAGLGGWAHGDLKNYSDIFHLGDHYLWAYFFDDQFRIIGGQGGGTPINTGGWLNADWLSYNGLRVFYVAPFGLSLGINFVDPGPDGIKPVEYLTTIMAGVKYEYQGIWGSLMFDNNPIYDDSDANYDGGLHGYRPLIGQAGNLGIGVGMNDIYAGAGMIALDMIVANMGEDHITSSVNPDYKYSPVEITAAIKTGYPWLDGKLYTEFKAKYLVKRGDNADFTGPAVWGLLVFEPYISYEILPGLKAELSIAPNFYINSYYLALDVTPNASGVRYTAGQTAPIAAVGEFASTYACSVNPKLSVNFGGATIVLGYEGVYSRDHAENTVYVDMRWAF
ncbi:MAG: hypothetical protein LBB98_14980 [Treponema sp.]|jgi:hypothetical protein|nr:hypothetical protein [Treponema sp.]